MLGFNLQQWNLGKETASMMPVDRARAMSSNSSRCWSLSMGARSQDQNFVVQLVFGGNRSAVTADSVDSDLGVSFMLADELPRESFTLWSILRGVYIL